MHTPSPEKAGLKSYARNFPKQHLLIAVCVCLGLFTLVANPYSTAAVKQQVAEPVSIQVSATKREQTAEAAQSEDTLTWHSETVRNGDSLSTIFKRAALTPAEVHQISGSAGGRSLHKIMPGDVFQFGTDENNQLQELRYIESPLKSLVFTRLDDNFSMSEELKQPDKLLTYREGVIEDSLYMSAQRAHLPASLIMELANIFGWDIDFVFDIRKGDSFSLLYEEEFLDGEKIGTGNIVAATFTNQGKEFQAVRFQDSKGHANYYTPDGLSMRKAFLRAPLDVFRVSSGFNLHRMHPIHKQIRAHRGVDYAAPRGTPVYAAGDGKVIQSGFSQANGNYVFIQHGQKYVTKYLHLTKRTVNRGQTVRQRQLIGTVGSTGYATGPHLHYEFLVNGVHRNPRTVELPQASPVPDSERANFAQTSQPLLAQLARYQQTAQLASLSNASGHNLN